MDVIDQIYESAVIPDMWPDVLDHMNRVSGSQSGTLFVFSDRFSPRGISTDMTSDLLEAFLQSDAWRTSPSVRWTLDTCPSAFSSVEDYLSEVESAIDPAWAPLAARGFGRRLVAGIPLSSGERVSFVLVRMKENGRYRPEEIAALDGLRPHLTRAALIAARMELERAQAMTAALEQIGLAAAVISKAGRVIAANNLLDALSDLFVPTAFGGIALTHGVRNAQLLETLARAGAGAGGPAASLPIPASDGHPPMMIHLLPVRGQAQDIFTGGHVVMVVSPVTRKQAPSQQILNALFDLTPAEARLVNALAAGGTLPAVAARLGLSVHTVRVQLRSVAAKTGVRRQGELLQLIATL
ncbi:helix-turn-helix transcriptional regulator [Sphingomonas koreensis]